jgi:hypothetical protein
MSSIVAEAPPEYAVILAVPLWPLPRNRTRTSPVCVRASRGSIAPIVAANDTSVPLCRCSEPTVGVVVPGVPFVPTAARRRFDHGRNNSISRSVRPS